MILALFNVTKRAPIWETNFKDAVRESDGPRLLRCWKAKMVLFKDARRHKYALEGFYFLADQLAVLNGRDSHRKLWNRGFNTNGGTSRLIVRAPQQLLERAY